MKYESVLIVVPLFNEESNVLSVLADLETLAKASAGRYTALLIDDGSTDRTSAVVKARVEENLPFDLRILHIILPCNMGVGMVHRVGYSYAEISGTDVVIQFDGDGQHMASQIELLLRELDHVDYVIGSRFGQFKSKYQMSRIRKLGTKLISKILDRKIKVQLEDSTSGFRAANRSTIQALAGVYPIRYLSDSVESIIIVRRKKLVVAEVQVDMRQRMGGQPSHEGLRIIREYLRLIGNISIFYSKRDMKRTL